MANAFLQIVHAFLQNVAGHSGRQWCAARAVLNVHVEHTERDETSNNDTQRAGELSRHQHEVKWQVVSGCWPEDLTPLRQARLGSAFQRQDTTGWGVSIRSNTSVPDRLLRLFDPLGPLG